MTDGFRRTRKGIVADLGDPERDVLLSLLQQTMALLESHGGPAPGVGRGHVQEPGNERAHESESDPDGFEAMMRRAGFTGTETGLSEGESAVGTTGPVDPAIRRLLPDGHRSDPEAAAEFRRLTGHSVRDRKLGHLATAVRLVASAQQGRVRLHDDEAASLLIAMTDVRLVLAQRLGLEDDEAAESLSERVGEMDPQEPEFALALGYEFLTWLQETLAVALTP